MRPVSRTFAPADADYRYDYNPYYSPEKCGLKLIAEVEWPNLSYAYCTTVAFLDLETGRVFLAQDSGCSCPTPFDNFEGTGDFIPYESNDQVRRLIAEHHDYDDPVPPFEVRAFIRAIREATR